METEIWIKGVLCLLFAAGLIWAARTDGAHPDARPDKTPKRRIARTRPAQAGSWLVFAALIATAAYYNAGDFHSPGYVHHWEQFHYQLGAKYFPELGYDGLYAASAAAQFESRPDYPLQTNIRDLRTNEMRPSAQVLLHGQEVRQRFDDERWSQFRDDHAHYLDTLQPNYLGAIRHDHGYNPTPTWTFVARLFAWADADRATLVGLGLLDPLLLLVLFVFVFRTYGSRIGCLTVLVFGLGYAWRFFWIGGAFLRLDWLAAVGIAVCMMRRERYRTAGALLAYAGMVRIFPFALLLGPGVLALRALVQRQDFGWAWRLAQGFVVGVLLCLTVGGFTGRGFDAWQEFAVNLEKHKETWLTNNVGLANVVLYDVDTMKRVDVDWSLPEPWIHWQAKMNRLEAERSVGTSMLAGFYLLLVALASWRARRDTSIVLGMGAIFSLALLTCYYWIMLLLVPIRNPRWGTVALLLFSAWLYGLHLVTPSFEMIYGLASWGLALLLLVWVGPDAWATVREGWEAVRGQRGRDDEPRGESV